MPDRPGLRDLYDKLAEQVGPSLADLAASDKLAEAVEVADAVRIRAGSELQRSSRRFLHAWNLPAGSDVTVLRQEIGSLERTVRTLARQVEALQQQLDQAAAEQAEPVTAAKKTAKTSTAKTSTAKTSTAKTSTAKTSASKRQGA